VIRVVEHEEGDAHAAVCHCGRAMRPSGPAELSLVMPAWPVGVVSCSPGLLLPPATVTLPAVFHCCRCDSLAGHHCTVCHHEVSAPLVVEVGQ